MSRANKSQQRARNPQSAIKIREPNPYILVAPAQAKALKPGWRKSLPVLVRINGKPRSRGGSI